ncbi:MAG: deoxyribose-phosphate aldolase [Bacteroidetes bacterium]|nr:MAG: deoxyribose-phosphate aldolase [Bacteroidota bacterium]
MNVPMSALAQRIEHTILKPDCAIQDIKRICNEAIRGNFAGVCIPPFYVRDARRILGEESPISVVTVVGFPMGYTAIAAKSEEIKRAVDEGADEIDAVLHIAALKSDNWNHVQHDIEGIARATAMRGRKSKLILECGLLTEDEIRRVCDIAREAGIHYLKTGTGFHGFPATVEMVKLLKSCADAEMKVKAAGGIRTKELAEALVAAGADRIGTSAGLALAGL